MDINDIRQTTVHIDNQIQQVFVASLRTQSVFRHCFDIIHEQNCGACLDILRLTKVKLSYLLVKGICRYAYFGHVIQLFVLLCRSVFYHFILNLLDECLRLSIEHQALLLRSVNSEYPNCVNVNLSAGGKRP